MAWCSLSKNSLTREKASFHGGNGTSGLIANIPCIEECVHADHESFEEGFLGGADVDGTGFALVPMDASETPEGGPIDLLEARVVYDMGSMYQSIAYRQCCRPLYQISPSK